MANRFLLLNLLLTSLPANVGFTVEQEDIGRAADAQTKQGAQFDIETFGPVAFAARRALQTPYVRVLTNPGTNTALVVVYADLELTQPLAGYAVNRGAYGCAGGPSYQSVNDLNNAFGTNAGTTRSLRLSAEQVVSGQAKNGCGGAYLLPAEVDGYLSQLVTTETTSAE